MRGYCAKCGKLTEWMQVDDRTVCKACYTDVRLSSKFPLYFDYGKDEKR